MVRREGGATVDLQRALTLSSCRVSTPPHLGKLDEIKGDVLEQEPGPKAGQVKRVKPIGPTPSPKL
jgi:hypothetical protein